MIRKLDFSNKDSVKNVLKLQIESYTIEAELIGFYEIPSLIDTIDSLKECDETFYGYFIEDILVGIVSYKIIEKVLDIHRVAVHPSFFKRGIAGKLVDFVEGINSDINKVVVCTGKNNIPAVSLYLKKGYNKMQDIEVSKGIYITEFENIL